jgi:hypothetical protein
MSTVIFKKFKLIGWVTRITAECTDLAAAAQSRQGNRMDY